MKLSPFTTKTVFLLTFICWRIVFGSNDCDDCKNAKAKAFFAELNASCDFTKGSEFFYRLYLCENADFESTRIQIIESKVVIHIDDLLKRIVEEFGTEIRRLQIIKSYVVGELDVEKIFKLFPRLNVFTFADNEQVIGSNLLDFLEYFDETRTGLTIQLDGTGLETAIPNNLSQVSSLRLKLNLPNGIEWDKITGAVELTELHIGSPAVANGSLPSSIGNLVNLDKLELISIGLNGELPEEICKLAGLGTLDVSSNELIGHFPRCIGTDLFHLSRLFARNNMLETIDQDMFTVYYISRLDLSQNNFRSKMPNIDIYSLYFLDFSHNPFEPGPMPFPPPHVKFIDMKHTNRNGTIPNEYAELYLQYFVVNNNDLSGELPPLRFRQTDPYLDTNLSISYNRLTGVVNLHDMILDPPASFASLAIGHNENITISPTDLETILGFIGDLNDVMWFRYLDLQGSGVTGTIPHFILSSYPVLYGIDLSDNPGIYGELPPEESLCLVSFVFILYIEFSYM
eukprot:TRINITY_DN2162_c0_g1_i1.p1 TRINITY_DN2162_c0_g1~~TRINITY_DN2162_c0_g1_i1.p1  ORF type:complete len:513 (-),score=99.18 TRINITY_DN2162_c0_g1_i1:112-1650(-)